MKSPDEIMNDCGIKVEVDFQGGSDNLESTPFLGDSGLSPVLEADMHPITGEVVAWNHVTGPDGKQYIVDSINRGEIHPAAGEVDLEVIIKRRGETAAIVNVDECAYLNDANGIKATGNMDRLSQLTARLDGAPEDVNTDGIKGVWPATKTVTINGKTIINENSVITDEDVKDAVNALNATGPQGALDHIVIDSIGSAFDTEEVTITPEDELKLEDELNVFQFMAKASPGFKRNLDFEKRMANNQLDLTNPEEIQLLQAYMQLIQKPMDVEKIINDTVHDKMKKKSRGNKTRWRDIKKGR